MDDARYRELVRKDLAHWVHPLSHPSDHQEPLLYERGEGIYLYGHDGQRYIDGLSSLWNVAVGHGRRELAEAAARQMERLAFNSSYVGSSNEPAIELAAKLVELAYDNMQAVFFGTSGADSNETSFKTARFYWAMKGRPGKVKVISRVEGYHGTTLACMSATGMSMYYPNFEPRVHEIVPAASVEPMPSGGARIDPGNNNVDNIAETIEREGPETVAAVIAEPVQGGGGVHPPPPDYFRQLREVCDRYEVLLIADEVITGFGRTGRWFALEHFGVLPDLMSVSKAITSAYMPLGASVWSREVFETITGADPSVKFMHGYTNSGHAVAAAVALRNLAIIEEEGLVENAAARGEQLLNGLMLLGENRYVGNVRGLGFMCGLDLLQDPENDVPFDEEMRMGVRLRNACQGRGLITRIRGDSFVLAPPLVATAEEVDAILTIVEEGVKEVTGNL